MSNGKTRETTTFFYADFNESSSEISFSQEESQHLQVLRVGLGCEIIVSNGKGMCTKAEITIADKRKSKARITSDHIENHPLPTTRLAIGFLKGRDLEEVVDLCTQIDLLSIDILHTDYSLSNRKDDHENLIKRMQQRSLTGLKQARKAWLTEIRGPWSFDEYLQINQGQKLLLDFDGHWPPHHNLSNRERTLFCGPEGGFSNREITLLKQQENVESLYLGNSRLRARTAPFFALGMLCGVELNHP